VLPARVMLRVSFELTAAGIVNRNIWAGPVDDSGSGESLYSLFEGEERVSSSSYRWSPLAGEGERAAFLRWLAGPVGFFESFAAHILAPLCAGSPDLGRAAFDLELFCELDRAPRANAYELRDYQVCEGDLTLSLPNALNCLGWRQGPEDVFAEISHFDEESIKAAYPELFEIISSLVATKTGAAQDLFDIWIGQAEPPELVLRPA
jgi:hypothetical protein